MCAFPCMNWFECVCVYYMFDWLLFISVFVSILNYLTSAWIAHLEML